MNFHLNLVLCSVLLITKHCLTKEECVQRRSGACKILTTLPRENLIATADFHSPQPDGFLLKTSMEFSLLENIHNFENNLSMEKKKPVRYNLDNAALVTVIFGDNDYKIEIHLGKKYYRLAELVYYNFNTKFREIKYNRYTPALPMFPYNLHLEVTTNGTIAIFADGNTKPFLDYQLTENVNVYYLRLDATGDQRDIIAFVDCSVKDKPNCGSHRVEKLYGCREWLVDDRGFIYDFEGFQMTYEKDVLFDEFIVVDTEYSSIIEFYCNGSLLEIEFKVNSIEARLISFGGNWWKKSVRTEQWFQISASPYAIRMLVKTGENNNILKISNFRSAEILSVDLCGKIESPIWLKFKGPKLYFDCTSDANIKMSERPRKTNETEREFEYHENGYNYTKTFLDTSKFVSGPFVTYHYAFGNSTQDYCPGNPEPKLIETSKYDANSLEGVIERSNGVIHSDLHEIKAQNNATVDTNAAVLTELKILSDSTKALLSEFRGVKTSIDALITNLQQNATTVNNYNYYNQLNLTEFLKFLKQN